MINLLSLNVRNSLKIFKDSFKILEACFDFPKYSENAQITFRSELVLKF